jgi:hypothetical protein
LDSIITSSLRDFIPKENCISFNSGSADGNFAKGYYQSHVSCTAGEEALGSVMEVVRK